MYDTPIPPIPWQITGNHWIALPCIHPVDGSIHAVGTLHRGARAAVEFAGSESFADGGGPALSRPVLSIDGVPVVWSDTPLAWERALHWLPTFTATLGKLVVRATIFAPYGRDADTAGAVYAFAFENQSQQAINVTIGLEGHLGHRQLRVRTPRPFIDAHAVRRGMTEAVILGGTAVPGLVGMAIGADGAATIEVPNEQEYAIRREVRVPPHGHADTAFFLAVGPEGDGAEATVAVMRRRGWRYLLASTRDTLRAFEQTTGHESVDAIINRNLLFAYFYGVGRALDDAHFYLCRTRVPWHSRGVTVREWESLIWTVPAVQLADPPLARELILRACELHGYSPGIGVRYLDGTLFEPGFSLEGAGAYAIAIDRYIRETGDGQIVEEPVIADTLYGSHEDISTRRHESIPLFSTEVTPSGRPAAFPYTLHGNAVAAQALDVFRRTLDEETARAVEEPEAVRAALQHHFAGERGGKAILMSAVNLGGEAVADDEPGASVVWLPMYETLDRRDSAYRRTVRTIDLEPRVLAQQIARLLGPDAKDVLQWLRRAPLHGGLAAEKIDADGNATANGGDASLAGLLAYTLWYAVHALGVTP
ncbi:MAG: hypothetical protein IT359_19495 [Gemmatimonadaceae bacterium]|nr:hypothetical protein [Gemmatimonadaceae bacterium]